MKNSLKLFYFLILSSIQLISAQEDEMIFENPTEFQTIMPFYGEQCGTHSPPPKKRDLNLTGAEIGSNPTFATSNTQYVLNVKVHFISNNVPVADQQNKALDIVGSLNVNYNQANIFFKYKGYDNISNPALLDFNAANINPLFTLSTPDAIHIFISDTFNGQSPTSQGTNGICITRMANFGGGFNIYDKFIVIRKDQIPVLNSSNPSSIDFKYYTLAHEMGHYLGLYHTHTQWKMVGGQLAEANDAECALEENYDGSQWSTLGDRIQDTNPDRSIRKYMSGSAMYNSNCTIRPQGWQANATCSTSVNFSLFNPSINNIMAYYNTCRTGFTQGQYTYMRNFITDESVPNRFLNTKMNTVDALYLAFDGGYAGGHQGTPPPSSPPRFQKGFDYEFVGCGQTTPTVMQSYGIHQIPTGHPYLTSIKITQVSTTDTQNCNYPMPSSFNGGEVITFDAMLYGGDYEVKKLNSQEIQNENLINTLPNGHHIIKKYLNDGQVLESNIIKNK